MARAGPWRILPMLALWGCSEVVTVEAMGSATVFVGVAVSGADSAFFTLGRLEPGVPAAAETGAVLELVVDGEAVPMKPGPRGACGPPVGYACYRGEPGGLVAPGRLLRLQGRLESGIEVRGEAVVPPVPPLSVEGAGPGDTVRGLSLTTGGLGPELLGLDAAPGRVVTTDTVVAATVWVGSRTLTCRVRVAESGAGFDLRAWSRVFVSALAPTCPGEPGVAWDSMAVPRTYMLYEEHFTRWASLPFALASVEGIGVEGVSGVFGAATPRTFVLIVTP